MMKSVKMHKIRPGNPPSNWCPKGFDTVQVSIFCLFLLIFILSPVSYSFCAEIFVPDDYPTITDALEMAEAGDTIIVKPGIYRERIKMKAGVNLVSYAGTDGDELVEGPGKRKVLKRALRTIIDGSDLSEPGYLISFPTETTEPMMVDGFTFQNMPEYVSSINLFMMEIRACSPRVVNNIFKGNKTWGGILATGLGIGMGPPLETKAEPYIAHNVICYNNGPGIANGSNSAAKILDNEIFGNRFKDSAKRRHFAPGIGLREKARPLIEGNLCYNNGVGIGILNLDSSPEALTIRNNEIHHNDIAGISIRGVGGPGIESSVLIEFNRIFNNLEVGVRSTKTTSVTLRYNEIFGNKKSGISLWDVNRAIIEDNEIYSNYTTGIRLLAVPMARVRRNHIYGNVTAGVDIVSWEKE
ncbi:MAG: DUF1565 domain-containing protein [Thermodesulfobacteria bacterium]|nr:DUF1565 domain-containing protein [Thermodesulfobacteriota bacterium]